MKDYDVAIVGAGPAGTSAAILLAQGGRRVLLLEKEHFPRHKLCGEFISPECLAEFARLGVGPQMRAAGGVDLSETVFYGRRGRGVAVPSEWFGAIDAAALGLSRAAMDAQLLQRARQVGVEVREGVQALNLEQDAGGRVTGLAVRVGAERHTVQARVLLDASGRGRVLARRVAGQVAPQRAPLVAFKTHLADSAGVAGTCEIYFYKGGYGGLNSVEGGAGNLCFIVSAADAKAHGGDAARIMRAVVMANPRAAKTLRGAHNITPWLAVALERFGHFAVAPAEGLLTVGDAAAFIDPFTGSGMLMALQGGALAAATIAEHLPRLAQDGAWAHLAQDYERRHREKFAARLRVCSWLRRAAFTPLLADAALFVAGLNDGLRRRLARATRQGRVLHEGAKEQEAV